MRFRPATVLRILALSAAAVICGPDAALAEPEPVTPDPAALLMTINGKAVRQVDLETLLRINFGPKFAELAPVEKQAVLINRTTQTRSQLVDRLLLVSAARAAGIEATREEIDVQIDEVKSQLPVGMAFEAYLKAIGVPAVAFRSHAEDQVLINKLSEQRTAAVSKPSESEIDIYYKQNPDYFDRKERARVSHILISTQNAITDEQQAAKRAQAEVARRKLLSTGPEHFAAVAHEISNCPSKSQGGDLGYIEKGSMVAAFDEAAFAQKIGTIGRVVRTPKGYHILKVIERQPAQYLTLEEARADIESVLYFQARDQVMEGYLRTLRLSAKVVTPGAAAAK